MQTTTAIEMISRISTTTAEIVGNLYLEPESYSRFISQFPVSEFKKISFKAEQEIECIAFNAEQNPSLISAQASGQDPTDLVKRTKKIQSKTNPGANANWKRFSTQVDAAKEVG